MSVDVNAVAAQVQAAMQGKLTGLGPAEVSAVQQASTILAQSLADIAAAKAGGQLTDDEASGLVTSATDDAVGVLEVEAGIAAQGLHGAVVAGLQTLASTALGAAGLGWAEPILQGAITVYEAS